MIPLRPLDARSTLKRVHRNTVGVPTVFGKQTECAIAAISRLAELYDNGETRVSASAIAKFRGLQTPSVAKVLATLSRAGIVTGSTGPGGGFSLAKHPSNVALYDVFVLFEREKDKSICPFGGGRCGVGEPCPLHDRLSAVYDTIDQLLHNTTFDVFREAIQERGWIPREIQPKRADRRRKKKSSKER